MKKRILPVRRSPLSLAVALAFSAGAHAQLPTDYRVTAGAAKVDLPSSTSMVVKQSGERLAMTWQSFGIGAGHRVQFVQPSASSVALNRVIGGSRSEIYGNLSANGQVFLVNPNGILFGKGAQVDVGGLVASTLDISERDFLDGKYVFTDAANRAAVINEGSLKGKYVALVGHQAINRGTIQAEGGAMALGGGSTVQIALADNKLVSFEVKQSALDALAENGGLIRADGGRVILTAGARDSLLASAVNNTGVIEARTVQGEAGNILLLAGMEAGTTRVGGTLDASAPASLNPQGGDGGFIETSAAHVRAEQGLVVTTRAPQGRTGRWLIDPQDYTIAANGGDITGAALSALLASTNVEIQSAAGAAAGNGDIHVNDHVSWNANELKLTAERDVNINAVMSASGTSTLVMDTGGTVKVGLDPFTGFRGRVDFDRSGTGLLTINGQGYTVINSLTDLQGMAADVSGRYALGANIDASASAGWNAGAGFAPVGDEITPFVGTFDGLGHVVTGLTIDRTSRVGLFGDSSGTVRNVGLSGGSVRGVAVIGTLVGSVGGGTVHNAWAAVDVSASSGTVGGLFGSIDNGVVRDVYASGNVTGALLRVGGLAGTYGSTAVLRNAHANGTVSGGNFVGGLIGESAGAVEGSSARGTSVTGTGTTSNGGIGGLIGVSRSTSVSNSFATANVSGVDGAVGGLIGYNEGSAISGSHATGAVNSTTDRAGGLVGYNLNGTITGSHATGAVDATGASVGGLVGHMAGTGGISDSHALGPVTSSGLTGTQGDSTGGLVGYYAASGALSNVYAEGNVSASGNDAGGLVGTYDSAATLDNAHAKGSVTATSTAAGNGTRFGGLIGAQVGNATVRNVHAIGRVSGRSSVGGLIGEQTSSSGGRVENAYAIGRVEASGTVPQYVGGLIGLALQPVFDSHASGVVHAPAGSFVGGLIGDSSAAVTDVYATGNVTGASIVGGLMGNNSAGIVRGHATGNVGATGSSAGGLAGASSGAISDSYANGTVGGASQVGGLVGQNGNAVSGSYATGAVSGTTDIGGLIGSNTAAVSDVHATGNVTGSGSSIGGLIGSNTGDVSDAYATGAVTSTSSVAGGLIGSNYNISAVPQTITRVHATGAVTGGSTLGGLLGDVGGLLTVSDSYATGAVSGTGGAVGGLIGRVDDAAVLVTRVYASGAVSGSTQVGGLVGRNKGTIQDAYATGEVSANFTTPRVGGVVGYNDGGTVQRVYAAAAVHNGSSLRADETTGGIIGENDGGGLASDNYWDGSARADQRFDIGATPGSGSTAGRLNSTTAQLQSSYPGWDFAGTWIIYDGFTYPLLRTFMTPLTVTANNAAKIYDGATFSGGNGVAYSAVPNADLLGTLGYAGTSQGARNAGAYNIRASGLYSHQHGYAISLVDGTLTVAQAPLSLSTTDVTKTYDGNTTAAGTLTVVGGTQLFGTDSLGGATFAFDTKNAGSGNKRVSVSGATVNDGNSGANYSVTYVDNTTSTITPKALTVSGITAASKVYDGNNSATVDASGASYAGLVAGDEFGVNVVTGTFGDKNVGTGKTVSLSSTYSGTDVGNYAITHQATANADITPKALTVSGLVADDKTYDGTTSASVNIAGASYAGLVAGDAVVVGATGVFADKNVGNGKAVTLSSSYTGADVGNYSIASQAASSADITPAALTVRASDLTKVEGSSYSFAGTEFSATGLATGDTIGGVLLSSPGAASSATIAGGPYAISASGATGGSFSLSNYNVTYLDGTMTLVAAPPAPVPPVVVEPPAAVPMPANAEALRTAIVEAQQVDRPRAPRAERSAGLNVTIVGAGINLPQGVE